MLRVNISKAFSSNSQSSRLKCERHLPMHLGLMVLGFVIPMSWCLLLSQLQTASCLHVWQKCDLCRATLLLHCKTDWRWMAMRQGAVQVNALEVGQLGDQTTVSSLEIRLQPSCITALWKPWVVSMPCSCLASSCNTYSSNPGWKT